MLRLTTHPTLQPARAVVFDKDGVLVDFAPFWRAVVRARIDALLGLAGLGEAERGLLTELFGIREGRIDPTGPLAMGARVEALTLSAGFLYSRGFDWLEARSLSESAFQAGEDGVSPADHVQAPGPIRPALEKLVARGAKLAVATSDTTANARRDLALLGISHCFSAVFGADAVARNKPHPDMLHAACDALGVEPHETWMVGDGLNDMRMARHARAAGAIAVASGITPAAWLAPEADCVLSGVWELETLLVPGEG
ncbi:MAG TPA: HAD family hydrolase [Pantanalinema sp.]